MLICCCILQGELFCCGVQCFLMFLWTILLTHLLAPSSPIRALSSLAKRINTPIANLVSEAAEMILNFSEVHHRLQSIKSNDRNIDDTATSAASAQHIQRDATKVVQFISKANPQLAKEYTNRTFIPSHYFSTEVTSDSELPPMHPIVVEIRARLMSGKINQVAKICRHLEECSGLPKPVTQHSWMLLLEKMHVMGTLIEDGSSPLIDGDGTVGEEVLKLGNIVVGSIGRSCVLEYLANVVLEARETLYPNQRGTSQAKQELRCLKDAVRVAVLKFLLTRAYSPRDALTIANKISDASNIPDLEDNSNTLTAMQEAMRILTSKLLYEEYNENIDNYAEEEEEVVAATASAVGDEEVLDEDGPVDMSVDQIGTPFVNRKSADDDNEPSSPDRAAQSAIKSPESLLKLKRWQLIQSSTKKHQHLRKTEPEPESPSFSPAPASSLKKVNEEEHVDGDEAAEVDSGTSSGEIAIDLSEDNNENQKGVEESATDNKDDDQETHQEEEDVEEGEYDSDATKSIQSIGGNNAIDEAGVEEEEEEEPEDMTYPRHYHEYPGNYSASDDYEQEDEEEADRHVAFHEPAGDASDGDSSNGPEVVDLLDDTSESDDDHAAKAVVDEEMASSEEERDEGEVLNESVDKYLASHTCDECKEECPEMCATCKLGACETCGIWGLCGGCEEVFCERCCEVTDPCSRCDQVLCPKCSSPCVECGLGASDDEDGVNAEDTDLNMADDEHDTEDDKYSLTEASQQGETFDEGEVNRQESPRSNQNASVDDDDHVLEQQQPSVLVAAAMSSQRQSTASNMPLQKKSSADNLSFDNTSAALASVDDNLSEYYDDKSQGENEEQESNVQVVARHHGHEMAIDSILNAHVDAIDSGDESSKADEKDNETGQGVMTDADDGYDAEVSEVEQTNLDKMTRSKAADDDGYLPDAEVSEVERTKTKKPKPTMEDEGYVPDGGHTTGGEEASEVEQGDDAHKKNKRDVRFEVAANLETTIAPSQSLAVEPATNLSIDDGYLPTDDGLTEEEKGPTAKSLALPAPSIDEGYIPDSGAITEEERLEKERKRRRYMDAEDAGYVPEGHTTAGEGEATDASKVGPDDEVKSPAKSFSSRDENSNEIKDPSKTQPLDGRVKDVIDEGYLPSAVEGEGTEEERSEEEGADIAAENISFGARSELSHSPRKDEALASVLVATATVLQQGGSEAGDIAQRASLPMKNAGNDTESYSSEEALSDERSEKEAPSEEIAPAIESPDVSNPAVSVKSPEERTVPDTLPDGEIEGEKEMEVVENEPEDAEMTVLPPEESKASQSENLPGGEDENEDNSKTEEVGKTSVRSEELAEDGHEEEVKLDDDADLPEVQPADNPTIQSEEEEQADDDESIGSLTVVKLKEMCRERGLKVGGKKAEIVQRIKDYDVVAAGNSVEKPPAAEEPQPQKKRGRGRPKKPQPLRQALEEHSKAEEVQRAAGPSSKSSSRKSARVKKPSSKIATQHDTPISALTHNSDSEMSDDGTRTHESEMESTRRSTAGRKSIPKTVVMTRGKKGSKLPAVPEGEEALEGDEANETSKPAVASQKRSTRAPEGESLKGDEETSKSVASSTKRSTRASTRASTSEATRRSTRSSTASVAASRKSSRSTKGKSKRYD